MRLLLICVMLLAACGAAAAQRPGITSVEGNSGNPNNPPSPLVERLGRDPAVYSRSVTGKIVALDSPGGLLIIEDARKTQLTFKIDAKVELKADKDTALGGKKDLSLTDYPPGEVVRVSYRLSDNKALAIRLKRPRG